MALCNPASFFAIHYFCWLFCIFKPFPTKIELSPFFSLAWMAAISNSKWPIYTGMAMHINGISRKNVHFRNPLSHTNNLIYHSHISIKVIFDQNKCKGQWPFYILTRNSVTKHRTYIKPYIFRILMIRRTRWHAFQLDFSIPVKNGINRSFWIRNGSHICKGKNGDNSILVGKGLKV